MNYYISFDCNMKYALVLCVWVEDIEGSYKNLNRQKVHKSICSISHSRYSNMTADIKVFLNHSIHNMILGCVGEI
jgi:hypothetical protein